MRQPGRKNLLEPSTGCDHVTRGEPGSLSTLGPLQESAVRWNRSPEEKPEGGVTCYPARHPRQSGGTGSEAWMGKEKSRGDNTDISLRPRWALDLGSTPSEHDEGRQYHHLFSHW